MSNLIITDTTDSERLAGLRIWMEESGMTPPRLADIAGVSPTFMRVLLRRETMPMKRHRQLVAIGVPEECLPPPIEPSIGRPRKIQMGLPCAQTATA